MKSFLRVVGVVAAVLTVVCLTSGLMGGAIIVGSVAANVAIIPGVMTSK